MEKRVATTGHRSRLRARIGGLLVLGAAIVAGAFAALPASAQIQLPPLPPVPLPTISPVDQPVGQTIDGVSKVIQGVPEQLGGGVQAPKPKVPAPKPAVQSQVDSWSLDRLPALRGSAVRTEVSSTRLGGPGSYSSLVSGGFKAAAGRAANLAGPLAAPLAVALFALGLLAIAARGPSRLVKVEEERLSFGERRSYRL